MIEKDCSQRLSTVGLFRAANAFWVTWSERVIFSDTPRHRNALTEIAWEDAVQGLGGNLYRSDIEKHGIFAGIVVYRQRVLQTLTPLGVVSLAF